MNPDLGNAWGNGTVVPMFWTTTRFEINVHPLVFIVFINGLGLMAPITLMRPLRYLEPFSNFLVKTHGRNRNTTLAEYGTLVTSKNNIFA